MKMKASRWMGILTLIHVLLSISMNQLIIALKYEVNGVELYKNAALSFGVFTVVWGAVAVAENVKKIRGKRDERKPSD